MELQKNEIKTKKIENFYYQLLIECHKKRKSVNQIERELGYPRNSLHNYKNGSSPSAERLIEMSEYFNVSPKHLLGIKETERESLIREFFQGLNTSEKREMSRFCHQWLLSQSSIR